MSEKAPNYVPEVVIRGSEELPTRDEAIDAFRDEINQLDARVAAAQEKPSIGFNGDTMDRINAEREKNEILRNDTPRLDALQAEWQDYGGEAVDKAQAEVDALNFNSDALEHVAAKTALRDAKEAFYDRMEKESKRVHDKDDALDLAYKEYAEREGKVYDVDENRVKDKEAAHGEAIEVERDKLTPLEVADAREAAHAEAIAEYKSHTGEEYDVYKGRVKDKEAAHGEALREQRERDHGEAIEVERAKLSAEAVKADKEAAHGEAIEIERDKLTPLEVADAREAAHAEAIAEYKSHTGEEYDVDKGRLDFDAAWDEAHPGFVGRMKARLYGLLAGGREREKSEDDRKGRRGRTLIVLGAVGAVGAVLAGTYLASRGHDVSTPPSGGGVGGALGERANDIATAPEVSEKIVSAKLPSIRGAEFPWNWAEKVVGSEHAMDFLEAAGRRAAKAGHDVDWYTNSAGNRVVTVDGTDNTQRVLQVLSQYAKK